MTEESQEKAKPLWNWVWKVLVALLVPIGALLAKDIYDYGKASLEAARGKSPVPPKTEPLRLQEIPQPIVAEALMERAKIRAQQGTVGDGKPIVQDVLSKNPLPLILAA
jgi:hypothetical protein